MNAALWWVVLRGWPLGYVGLFGVTAWAVAPPHPFVSSGTPAVRVAFAVAAVVMATLVVTPRSVWARVLALVVGGGVCVVRAGSFALLIDAPLRSSALGVYVWLFLASILVTQAWVTALLATYPTRGGRGR